MAVDPTGADLRRFGEAAADGPVYMLNLLRFADGGREGYREYARRVAPFLRRVGASVVYAGDCAASLIATDADRWDAVLLVRYPSREAFLAMVADPDYREISRLRTSALTEAALEATEPWPEAEGARAT